MHLFWRKLERFHKKVQRTNAFHVPAGNDKAYYLSRENLFDLG
jgi:hypothetical protein